jgi:6-pyruvoyltetrahydropterin/6-carboxytetrahydropterin synthase
MIYRSTKTYGTDRGLSCCFRQWRATHSHCSLIHGYSLGFRFEFGAVQLDEKNWVVDFGNLGGLKKSLEEMFDHTTVVAEDDPQLFVFKNLPTSMCDLRVVERVGCESFAEIAFQIAVRELDSLGLSNRVKVLSVECMEHGSNSAIYCNE